MATVRAAQMFEGSVHEAETIWYDTSNWPSWVDGLASVASVQGDWPRAGATVTWDSSPAGRGRVVERVASYEQLRGQTLDVEDESIRGTQSVAFTPVDEGVEVEMTLAYRIKKRSIVMPVLDFLFIRRAMASSLTKTVTRFGVELAAAREPHGHPD
jgi:hypothetical protein